MPEPTEIMDVHLVSQQFAFDDGAVRVFLRGPSAPSSSLSAPTKVRDNRITGLDVPSGDCTLLFEDCEVASRATGMRRRVAWFFLPIHLTDGDRDRGYVELNVGFHAFLRVEVVDAQGQRVRNRPEVGVMLDTHSVEGRTNEQGYVDLLAAPGSHGAYLLERPAPTFFVVNEEREDAEIVRLVE